MKVGMLVATCMRTRFFIGATNYITGRSCYMFCIMYTRW